EFVKRVLTGGLEVEKPSRHEIVGEFRMRLNCNVADRRRSKQEQGGKSDGGHMTANRDWKTLHPGESRCRRNVEHVTVEKVMGQNGHAVQVPDNSRALPHRPGPCQIACQVAVLFHDFGKLVRLKPLKTGFSRPVEDLDGVIELSPLSALC